MIKFRTQRLYKVNDQDFGRFMDVWFGKLDKKVSKFQTCGYQTSEDH